MARSESQQAALGSSRPASTFVSFCSGTAELISGLCSALGEDLHTAVGVQRMSRLEDGSYALEVRGSSQGQPAGAGAVRQIRADAVVLAVPAYTAAALLAPVSRRAAAMLESIRYVSTGSVSLAYLGDGLSGRFDEVGVLVPRSEKRPINAITWLSKKFNYRAPQGCALFRVFFGGSRSPQSMNLDDEELVAVVKRELRNVIGLTKETLFHRIFRWEEAMPQYEVNHLDLVGEIESALPPGLWVTGS
ncbi:MAG: protoporphyrinogen oxidase, partial [Thermoleophilia bacterium]|nr:protoporphyrinogen oxidase [Thermoleophilia bacterium]